MPAQAMLAGMSKAELQAMPPFPFPRELFPPGTFPAGLRFSREGLEQVPPSIEALRGAGDGAALGAMYAAAASEADSQSAELHQLFAGAASAPPAAGADAPRLHVPSAQGAHAATQAELQSLLLEGLMEGEVAGQEGTPADLERLQKLCGLQGLPAKALPAALHDLLSAADASDSGSEAASDDSNAHTGASQPRVACGAQADAASPQPPCTSSAAWFNDAKHGDVDGLRQRLAEDASLLHVRGAGIGHTALHWAAANGGTAAAAFLLEQGADVNARNACNSTPLHSAATHGRDDVVTLLLQADGCDAQAVNDDGDMPLALARRRGHTSTAVLLQQRTHAAPSCAQSSVQPNAHFSAAPAACAAADKPVTVSPDNCRGPSKQDARARSCAAGKLAGSPCAPKQQAEGSRAAASSAEQRDTPTPTPAVSQKQATPATAARHEHSIAADSIPAVHAPAGATSSVVQPVCDHAPASEGNTAAPAHPTPPTGNDSAGTPAWAWSKAVAWHALIDRAAGNAWMQAAQAGKLQQGQKLLVRHPALLLYRGKGTSFGFCGALLVSWQCGLTCAC